MECEIILNEQIARDFYEMAQTLPEYPNDYGAMRELRDELVKTCGVNEIEAINILRGVHIVEYIAKYQATLNENKLSLPNTPEQVPDFLIEQLKIAEFSNIVNQYGEALIPVKNELMNQGVFTEIFEQYALGMEGELCKRTDELLKQKEKLLKLNYHYLNEGDRITDDDLRYILPEHFIYIHDIERAIELAGRDIVKKYEEWRNISYIKDYIETKISEESPIICTYLEYNLK